MIDLATKQAFWCEQLPNFEAKYWLPSHFEFLIFDKDQGNYVIKEDLDPSFEDEATEIFHRVNTGWAMWKKAINFNDQQAEIDSLKAENIELQKKYQHADTQLSDIDGHYTLLKKEVEALKAKLEQSKKVWISVENGLPEFESRVLVFTGNLIEIGNYIDEQTNDFDFYFPRGFWNDGFGSFISDVTHWMLLPKAQGDEDE